MEKETSPTQQMDLHRAKVSTRNIGLSLPVWMVEEIDHLADLAQKTRNKYVIQLFKHYLKKRRGE